MKITTWSLQRLLVSNLTSSANIQSIVDQNNGCLISINLIPHTIANTSLGNLAVGSPVNIEIDLIARYVERMLNASTVSKANLENLGVSA